MFVMLIILGASALLARFLSYKLPMGWKFAGIAVVLCFLAGPVIGLATGVMFAYSGIASEIISPKEYILSAMAEGLVASVFCMFLVPFFRRQRRKEEALAWKYR